jgi:predicted component of type VI protein secretion system
MHASMRFDAGRWHIKNLSGTNPLVVNGEPLPANGTEQLLNDGDQVEMGDMVFLFRSR